VGVRGGQICLPRPLLSELQPRQKRNKLIVQGVVDVWVGKGAYTLAFFASVSPFVMALPPYCFLCTITYVITQEKQSKQLGSGAIADWETDAKKRV
jgi:hypothetical protein